MQTADQMKQRDFFYQMNKNTKMAAEYFEQLQRKHYLPRSTVPSGADALQIG